MSVFLGVGASGQVAVVFMLLTYVLFGGLLRSAVLRWVRESDEQDRLPMRFEHMRATSTYRNGPEPELPQTEVVWK